MEADPRFFVLIIGTEILNRRRSDRHFDFLSQALLERGYKLSGSFIIEDDPALIVQILKFLASQPGSVSTGKKCFSWRDEATPSVTSPPPPKRSGRS